MATKLDARQIRLRDALVTLLSGSDKEVDDILRSIESQITPPLRADASSPTDLTVSVSSSVVSNVENNRKKSILHIGSTIPTFTSGTVTYPSVSGGTVTVSPGANTTLTVPNNEFIKSLIALKSNGDLEVTFGTSNASEASADVPLPAAGTMPICYVTLFNNAGTIDNISQNKIFQFNGVPPTAAAVPSLVHMVINGPYGILSTPVDMDPPITLDRSYKLIAITVGALNSGSSGTTTVEVYKNGVSIASATLTATGGESGSTTVTSVNAVQNDTLRAVLVGVPSGNPENLGVSLALQPQ